MTTLSTLATAKEYAQHIKQMLMQHLRDCHNSNAIATYKDLSEIAGFDVTTDRGRYYANAARKKLQESEGLAFEVVSKKGYKPIPVGKMAKQFGDSATQKIAGATSQFRENLGSIDTQRLKTQAEIKEYLHEQVRCGYYERAVQDASVKVDAAVEAVKAQTMTQNTIKQSIKAAYDQLGR